MTIRARHAFINTLSPMALGLFAAASFAQGERPESPDGDSLQEVTVTAQRVAARLQEVPLSVTALTLEELQDRQILSTVDLARQVPNLVGNPQAGMGSALSFYMRGAGQDESIATTDPAVGVYVDGVYLSRAVANNVLLYDLERVEVLRGPQGTLYGRNTSAGAIKLVTKKPDANFSGSANTSYEFEYDRYLIGGLVNVPLTDNLFGKVSAVHTKQGEGFIESLTTGQDLWSPEATGIRAQLRWAPSDAVDITGTVDYLKDEGQEMVGQNNLGADTPSSIYEVRTGLRDQFLTTETKAFTLNAVFDRDAFSIESITGVRELDERFIVDVSDLEEPAYVIPTLANYKQWSQEFTVSGSTRPLSWVAGVFYMDEDTRSYIGDELYLFGGAFAGNFVKDLRVGTKSSAVFAHATWHVTDRLDLTAGARYTEERKYAEVNQFEVLGAAAPGSIAYNLPGSYPGAQGPLQPMWDTAEVEGNGTDMRPTFTNFDPKIGIDFKFSDSIMVFASRSEGFKSGGWNARVTDSLDFVLFDAETVVSYEAGLKSEWYDRRVRANVTLFHADYDDFQITAVNPASGGFVTLNAAEMRNQGVEAELQWKVSSSLNLAASIGTMDAKYTRSDSPLVSSATKVKNTPEVSYLLSADFNYPVGNGQFIANVQYAHKDDYYANLENSPPGYIASFGLVDAMAGYESGDGAWRLALSCKNCAGKEVVHAGLDFESLGFATRYQIPPRQVFLSLNYDFAP